MARVIAVHLEDEDQGESGITEVKLEDGSTKAVTHVVKDIDGNQESYYYTIENKRADIISVKNPDDAGKHIRTAPDQNEENNLLELDRY